MQRIAFEKRVVREMIAMYCRCHHSCGSDRLCGDCSALLRYAHNRLEHCAKGNAKRSCRKCEIHCYNLQYRLQIREVMKYAGPRMLLHHPWWTLRHLCYELR
ncbi:MAG: nitrous oxide-stimulated promoter family protein [Muribaculaceae bacterium]|nr:nitrous oxide-stimulated promoter family protein [Muribaculaceae bacterium]